MLEPLGLSYIYFIPTHAKALRSSLPSFLPSSGGLHSIHDTVAYIRSLSVYQLCEKQKGNVISLSLSVIGMYYLYSLETLPISQGVGNSSEESMSETRSEVVHDAYKIERYISQRAGTRRVSCPVWVEAGHSRRLIVARLRRTKWTRTFLCCHRPSHQTKLPSAHSRLLHQLCVGLDCSGSKSNIHRLTDLKATFTGMPMKCKLLQLIILWSMPSSPGEEHGILKPYANAYRRRYKRLTSVRSEDPVRFLDKPHWGRGCYSVRQFLVKAWHYKSPHWTFNEAEH